MEEKIVYFTKKITPESLVKIYKIINSPLTGNIAIKLHSGEDGNQNYVKPEFVKDLIDCVNGTVVECNTAYNGQRNSTNKHLKLLEKHGWNKYFDVDLLDEEDDDLVLDIPNGKVINKNYVGKNLTKYDSMLVLSHFKGHPMGGFGGALKQLSIGIASSRGKSYIHSAGKTLDQNEVWKLNTKQDLFLESMADAATSVVNYFKGNIVYINILCNLSVDCDCCAKAEDPCMKDIGILLSLDPVAIDKASVDLVYSSEDEGKKYLIERIESRNGLHTIEEAEQRGIGTTKYKIVDIDKEC
ncbi:MAG: DUF362 domain-containing protein [bacterium]|nr:DUF362 domain-containing protein [bacterium]